MKKQWLLEGIGAALLIVGPLFYSLLFPGDLALYHHRFDLASMMGGLFLDMFGILILYVAVVATLSRLPDLPRRIGTSCLAGFFLWSFIRTVVSLYVIHEVAGGLSSYFGHIHPVFFPSIMLFFNFKIFVIIFPAVLILIAVLKPAVAVLVIRSVRLGLAAFAFCGIWMVPQLLYMGFLLHPIPPIKIAKSQPPPARQNRIVWILFDELSYNLVFDHPQEGMKFPNFQRLRSQSVSFANIEPAGVFTDRILPSLFTGREISDVRGSSKGTLEFFDRASQKWLHLNPRETLLGSAKVNGWHPAMVGWHNPYCKDYDSVLTACYWVAGPFDTLPFEGMGMSARKSVLANALMVLPNEASLSGEFFPPPVKTSPDVLHKSVLQYQDIMKQAGGMIQEGQVRFLFIHLPIPHPPGFFDRKTHRVCECGNYLDNLVLSDDTLGLLLDQIKSTPWARDTTVIVSSDHSWRVPLWGGMSDWTAEEQRVSQGKFDSRPVFLVHFPGQDASDEVSVPSSELVEHDLVNAMLSDKIKNRTGLDEFLQHQSAMQALKEKP